MRGGDNVTRCTLPFLWFSDLLQHYNMATMVGSQGCNRGNWAQASDPRLFNPNAALDTDSWGRAMQAANISYAVYVAKHNCGFTTFPTKATLPDGSPYNYSIQYSSSPDLDVVASFLATCKKYNIHPGFYYSISTNTYLNVDGRVVSCLQLHVHYWSKTTVSRQQGVQD